VNRQQFAKWWNALTPEQQAWCRAKANYERVTLGALMRDYDEWVPALEIEVET